MSPLFLSLNILRFILFASSLFSIGAHPLPLDSEPFFQQLQRRRSPSEPNINIVLINQTQYLPVSPMLPRDRPRIFSLAFCLHPTCYAVQKSPSGQLTAINLHSYPYKFFKTPTKQGRMFVADSSKIISLGIIRFRPEWLAVNGKTEREQIEATMLDIPALVSSTGVPVLDDVTFVRASLTLLQNKGSGDSPFYTDPDVVDIFNNLVTGENPDAKPFKPRRKTCFRGITEMAGRLKTHEMTQIDIDAFQKHALRLVGTSPSEPHPNLKRPAESPSAGPAPKRVTMDSNVTLSAHH